MDKTRSMAVQVTKEIIVKFIELGRISPTNFSDYFAPIYQEVLHTIEAGENAPQAVAPESSISDTDGEDSQTVSCPHEPAVGEHGEKVASMFGRIAGWYDFLNHSLSFGQDIYWRYRLVRHVRAEPDGMVLDLAAGTMDVSLELARQLPGTRILAMDFSMPMLRKGAGKISCTLAPRMAAALADGRHIPLPDACADAVTIAFGIRNIIPRAQAFGEILRVLKPGGRLCVLEFGSGQTRIWRGMYNFYLDKLLPMAGKLISGDSHAYRYLAETIKNFPPERDLAREMTAAGFAKVFWQPLLSGIVYIHVAQKDSGKPDLHAEQTRLKTTCTVRTDVS